MRLARLLGVFALAIAGLVTAPPLVRAADGTRYREAPEAVHAVLDAKPNPAMRIAPDGKHVVFARTALYPQIADLAAPMLKLAGVRIDPRNRAQHGGRHFVELSLRGLPDGAERRVALPAGARIDDVVWNPAGTKVALTNVTDRAVELWILDVATAKARRITGVALNPMLGAPVTWMPDGSSLLVRLVGSRGAAPVDLRAPTGPRVESSAAGTVASSTYEARDLLVTQHDADLFEHHATTQLAVVDGRGKLRRLGAPAVIAEADPSPDGRFVLVTRILRPYSFTRPYSRFPQEVELWDSRGVTIETIASVPVADTVPVGGVRTGPREFAWRATAPATLVWAEALDGGDTYKNVPHHDRLMTRTVGGAAKTWRDSVQRHAGIWWLEDGKRAIVLEVDRDAHRIEATLVDAADPSRAPKTLWARSYDDRYGDPGTPVFRVLPSGAWVVRQDGDAIFLAGAGASEQGERPFLDRLELGTLATQRWFRSARDRRESFMAWIDPAAGTFLVRGESASAPANLALHTLAPGVVEAATGESVRRADVRALTTFADPAPQIRTLTKQLVKYERADGIPLSFTMYLPPGYTPGTPMPTVMWAYPLDYTEAATAGQVNGSPHEFTQVIGASPIFLALAGYVVLDEVAMPVVGPSETAYDTFLEQIEANARAAIDEAVALGVTDRDRVGVFGHSHGGLMTANLLAWTDLFRAGVARSGAYNHTMRPFGFQNERRSLYAARKNYLQLSALLHADRIDEPLLIIHGAVDANPGTVPLQSEKLFEAVRGTGGTTRLVMLPHESHGYIARESVEHVLAETIGWFDTHVKNAGPRVAKNTTGALGKTPVIRWKAAPGSVVAGPTTECSADCPAPAERRRQARQQRRAGRKAPAR